MFNAKYSSLQYEAQVRALREKIAAKRQQLQENSKKKDSFHSRSILLLSTNEKAEQDLLTYRYMCREVVEEVVIPLLFAYALYWHHMGWSL